MNRGRGGITLSNSNRQTQMTVKPSKMFQGRGISLTRNSNKQVEFEQTQLVEQTVEPITMFRGRGMCRNKDSSRQVKLMPKPVKKTYEYKKMSLSSNSNTQELLTSKPVQQIYESRGMAIQNLCSQTTNLPELLPIKILPKPTPLTALSDEYVNREIRHCQSTTDRSFDNTHGNPVMNFSNKPIEEYFKRLRIQKNYTQEFEDETEIEAMFKRTYKML